MKLRRLLTHVLFLEMFVQFNAYGQAPGTICSSAAQCPWLQSVNQGFCSAADATEAQARLNLYPRVLINRCPCTSTQQMITGCTEVKGLRITTINALLTFVSEYIAAGYGPTIVVTGGSESYLNPRTGKWVHGPGEDPSSFSHDNGYKVDIVDGYLSGGTFLLPLTTFINSRFDSLGRRGGDDCGIWGMSLYSYSPGPQFAHEGVCSISEPEHWDMAFPAPGNGGAINSNASSSATFTVRTIGTGSGTVSSVPSLISNCANCGPITFTRGMNVDFTANPDADSICVGWPGLDPATDTSNGTSATAYADENKIISVEFSDRGQPPPDDPACWIPTSTGWTWNYPACPKGPPMDGGTPPPANGHCWQWYPATHSWQAVRCGGNCVTQSGTPSTLNFGSCNPTSTHTAILVVGAHDPNDKSGSEGAGPLRFISGATPLRYAISFDNDLTATAPARTVEVTDPLPSPNLDLSTFALGPIFVAGQFLTPPMGAQHYSTTIDLRPSKNMLLGVNAGLNVATGLVTFAFASLDANTHAPITDPTAGFLAPGDLATVFFTVMPKTTVPTTTNVQNQATVIFDANAPVPTPTWSNALDFTPPMSHVLSLPPQVSTPTFVVNWAGSDDGAGMKDYTVYVSIDAAPFTIWQRNTASTQANFLGAAGHAYAFYSIGRDLVDNVEQQKTVAEASTTVGQAGVPGDVNGDGQIDCVDIAAVKASFGKRSGDPTFDSRADINGDGIVDIRDLAFISQHLPAGTHCP